MRFLLIIEIIYLSANVLYIISFKVQDGKGDESIFQNSSQPSTDLYHHVLVYIKGFGEDSCNGRRN